LVVRFRLITHRQNLTDPPKNLVRLNQVRQGLQLKTIFATSSLGSFTDFPTRDTIKPFYDRPLWPSLGFGASDRVYDGGWENVNYLEWKGGGDFPKKGRFGQGPPKGTENDWAIYWKLAVGKLT